VPRARNERKLQEQWARESDPEAWALPNSREKDLRRLTARNRAMTKIIETREQTEEPTTCRSPATKA
jgi:hypothetical protein